MGVSVRPHKGKWMVDVRGQRPNGERFRDRRVVSTTSKQQAHRWGLERERMLTFGETVAAAPTAKATPTFAEFWPRFMEHLRANRQKHSSATLKESHWKTHLEPTIGGKRLEDLSVQDVQDLKLRLDGRAAKTVNNLLSTLTTLLTVAIKLGVIGRLPCEIATLDEPDPDMDWYEEEVLQALIGAAQKVHDRCELVVLLGARAGLRAGEMQALTWRDVDFKRELVTIRRNVYRGVEGTPKGGKTRVIPLSPSLLDALERSRSLAAGKVLDDATPHAIRDWMQRAQRIAGIGGEGRVHVLRHTFGTHLVLAGVNLLEVQRLMGHQDLKTTMRYLHSAGEKSQREAVALLEIGDRHAIAVGVGNRRATGQNGKLSR